MRPAGSNKYVTSGNHTIYVPGGANIGDYVRTPPAFEGADFDLSEIVGPANATAAS